MVYQVTGKSGKTEIFGWIKYFVKANNRLMTANLQRLFVLRSGDDEIKIRINVLR